MNFQIEVINVQATTKPTKKGSYIMLDVAFKNLSSGKVEGKKIMSFAQQTAFDVLSKASMGSVFTVTSEKNEESGYWDWVNVVSGGQEVDNTKALTTKAPGGFASPKSTYETAEERAKRQVLIVRQSSITAAISTLKTDKKELAPADVLNLAQVYCDWVFQTEVDTPDIYYDMDDDIPL